MHVHLKTMHVRLNSLFLVMSIDECQLFFEINVSSLWTSILTTNGTCYTYFLDTPFFYYYMHMGMIRPLQGKMDPTKKGKKKYS